MLSLRRSPLPPPQAVGCAILLALSLIHLGLVAAPAAAQDEASLAPYETCLEALVSDLPTDRKIPVCQEAAEAGIPTAQYVLGLLLLEGGEEAVGRPEVALRWLRLAAERGHPGAQLETSRLLREGVGGEPRPDAARRFLDRAICTGLPQAHEEARELGIEPESVPCEAPGWEGIWSGEVTWVHASLGAEEPRGRSTRLRLDLGPDGPRVATRHEDAWVELKSGLFRWAERGTNAILVALDGGWDLDGGWTETSNLSLVRTGPDTLEILWTRMIHNEHMPASLEARTLAAVARGRLERQPPDPGGRP